MDTDTKRIETSTSPADRWHGREPSSMRLRLRLVVVVAVLVPVILACTSVTTLKNAPASDLQIIIRFTGALIPGATTTVSVGVGYYHNPVAFAGSQRFSINGIMIPMHPQSTVTIARVPAGANAYVFAYDDGHGRQTAVRIPTPRTDFALLQPAAFSQVPLPRPLQAHGTGGSHGQPTATVVPTAPGDLGPRPAALADTPLSVRYGLPYQVSDLPLIARVGGEYPIGLDRYAIRFHLTGVCGRQWAYCGVDSDDGDPTATQGPTVPTGTWSIDDRSMRWGGGFETLVAGPGAIEAYAAVQWQAPETGFNSFVVEMNDSVHVPITWV